MSMIASHVAHIDTISNFETKMRMEKVKKNRKGATVSYLRQTPA